MNQVSAGSGVKNKRGEGRRLGSEETSIRFLEQLSDYGLRGVLSDLIENGLG